MIDYHKIFIGIEFTKKDTWKWNIIYFITATERLSTIKLLSKTYPLLRKRSMGIPLHFLQNEQWGESTILKTNSSSFVCAIK